MMTLKLHNTLSRQTEDFKPLNPPRVTVYSCGPTVYDRLHIGNWLSYIRWDILARVLQHTGYQLDRVINITDVGHLTSDADEGEDKLEKGARREGKSAWEIAKNYTDDFLAGMKELKLLPPSHYANATDHIDDQIELIKQLETKGYTYVISDGVYFDTAKFPAYADFARLDLKDQREGARVGINPQKRQPQDFALWKFSPAGKKRDMEWESPWGKGFPGWHIECSAMAMKYLGKTIDIHTGGIDHIPVHHTNEIAQSQAATDQRFANFWLHNNFLLVDGTKISKSLNNGITLQDLKDKGFSPLDFKMFVLQSHYRTESNFTWENLGAAKNRLTGLQAFADLRYQLAPGAGLLGDGFFEDRQAEMTADLANDLAANQALSRLNEIIDYIYQKAGGIHPKHEQDLAIFLRFLDNSLGLELLASSDITQDQKQLVKEREQARQAGDWAKADRYRAKLGKEGLEINDTPLGPVWSRV